MQGLDSGKKVGKKVGENLLGKKLLVVKNRKEECFYAQKKKTNTMQNSNEASGIGSEEIDSTAALASLAEDFSKLLKPLPAKDHQ